MDPNEALQELIDSIREGDEESSREIAEALVIWIQGQGFIPRISSSQWETVIQDWCLRILADSP